MFMISVRNKTIIGLKSTHMQYNLKVKVRNKTIIGLKYNNILYNNKNTPTLEIRL